MTPSISPWKKLRKRLELLLVKLAFLVIPPLPRPCLLFLARAGGRAGYALTPGLRRIGRANLDLAYGHTLTPREKRGILKESCQTFARAVLDIFWFTRDTEARVRRYVVFDEAIPKALFEDGAAICVTAHMGSWEVLSHAMAVRGFPLLSVAAPLANPAVEDVLLRARESLGQEIVFRQGAVRALLKALRAGRKIALLLDQNTKPAEGGVFVDFFGLPATISSAAALLALKTGAPVFLGFSIPRPDGTYLIHGPPEPLPFPGEGEEAPMETMTRDVANGIEQAIRRYPGAWLWMYKRWKYFRAPEEAGRYPPYARQLDASELS